MIHKSSDVQTENIGSDTTIWQFCVVLKGAKIGSSCNINAQVFIENHVVIGDRVTIKSGVQLWDGVEIENDVFVGPNVTFTNDLRPRSKQYLSEYRKTLLKNGCSVGANSTILPGITIGIYAMVGAGSVVTKNVPNYALVYGNPARIVAWLDESGEKMKNLGNSEWQDNKGAIWVCTDNTLIKK
jgi:acetyltransferase-like isoleucine patch superfamily enzyme